MKTPLYDEHVSLGARMVDFHGWEMPIEYSKIIDEHIAVRNSAGIFDVSHMGDIIISGLDVNDFIDHVFPTDITSMEPGHCIYTAFLNDFEINNSAFRYFSKAGVERFKNSLHHINDNQDGF